MTLADRRRLCHAVGMNSYATARSGASAPVRESLSNVISIENQKGGVAKSMLTLALSAHTGQCGGEALAVDVDPQGTAYDFSQRMTDPGYDFIHETDPAQLQRIRELRRYDDIWVDTPGNRENMLVLKEVEQEASYILIPYDYEPESFLPTMLTVEQVRESGKPFAVVVTKAVDEDMVKAAWETLDDAGVHHLRSYVLKSNVWRNSLLAKTPITRHKERYAPRLQQCIGAVHTEVHMELSRRAA